MGYRPEMQTNIESEPTKGFSQLGKKRAEELQNVRQTMREVLEHAKRVQKQQYDKRRQPKRFTVGDWVTINAKSISTSRPSPKLDHKRIGPFQVIDAWGKQAYKVKLTPPYQGNCLFSSLAPMLRNVKMEEFKYPEDAEELETEPLERRRNTRKKEEGLRLTQS